jgi:Protein of unknown function (DUF2934)
MNEATRKKIEQRAYEIYVKRGSAPGNAKSDWDQAEKEIMAELNAPRQSAVVKEAPLAKPAPASVAAKPAQPIQAKKPQQQQKKR